jgi:hypothetical protein
MISVASRSAAMIEALRDVNGLARRPSTVPLKIFFKREQTVRLSLIYTTRTTQHLHDKKDITNETHDNSNSLCAHAPEHVRACKRRSS